MIKWNTFEETQSKWDTRSAASVEFSTYLSKYLQYFSFVRLFTHAGRIINMFVSNTPHMKCAAPPWDKWFVFLWNKRATSDFKSPNHVHLILCIFYSIATYAGVCKLSPSCRDFSLFGSEIAMQYSSGEESRDTMSAVAPSIGLLERRAARDTIRCSSVNIVILLGLGRWKHERGK